MSNDEIKIGAGFFEKFKTYLKKSGMKDEQLANVTQADASSVFSKSDVADGEQDGKTTEAFFFAEVQKLYEELAQLEENLEAWKELAGDDEILETSELALEEEEPPVDDPTAPPPSPGIDEPTTPTSPPDKVEAKYKPVDAASLKDKPLETLRSERDGVMSDINAERSKMKEATATLRAEVATAKKAYEDALESAEDIEIKIKDEKGVEHDLKAERAKVKGQITQKEGEISTQEGVVSDKKSAVSEAEGALSDCKASEPQQSDYMTTDENGASVPDVDAYNAAHAAWEEELARCEEELAKAKDELAQEEEKLLDLEAQLKELQTKEDVFDKKIAEALVEIALKNTEKQKTALAILEALEAYTTKSVELEAATKQYEANIAVLQANLQTYNTAVNNAKQTPVEKPGASKGSQAVERPSTESDQSSDVTGADADSVTVHGADGNDTTLRDLIDTYGFDSSSDVAKYIKNNPGSDFMRTDDGFKVGDVYFNADGSRVKDDDET